MAESVETIRKTGAPTAADVDAAFVELARELAAQKISVRHIAALTGRSKSAVGRAVKTAPPERRDLSAEVGVQVLYDAFHEAGSALLGYYIAFRRDSRSDVERDLWTARMQALKSERDGVGPDDREQMTALFARWSAERAHLATLRRRGGDDGAAEVE
ncbi:MAG: hypothetical protein LBH76_06275 [Propionibacteriaceae bacterium]|nr:hypothetical protein [Propionibacteriaceae bacterium]